MIKSSPRLPHLLVSVAAALLLAAGCAAPPPAPEPAPAPAQAPVEPSPPTTPAAAPAPELTPAQAKAEAQKLAIQAVDLLQNGDEAGARTVLEKASSLDASNELARKLLDQIKADAQKELGPVFFRYTVQRDDSLSKLAAAYLGDRFRFYILAKYNDIANPSRVAAGQVIKIPGKERPPAAAPGTRPGAPTPAGTPAAPGTAPGPTEPAPSAPTAAPAPGTPPGTAPAAPAPAAPETTPQTPAAKLMEQGRAQQKAGKLEDAYASFSDAARAEPGNRDAIMQRDGVKAQLIRSYDRDAQQAFQRQNLDLAIRKWDQVLELDPNNQKAKLERERALELKKKLSEKFGPAGSAPAPAKSPAPAK